jgi:hypothetical protein
MAPKNNISAYVLGVGLTKFIKPRKERNYVELGYEAGVKAMLDAQINYDEVETGVACYCYGDTTSGQRIFYQFGMSTWVSNTKLIVVGFGAITNMSSVSLSTTQTMLVPLAQRASILPVRSLRMVLLTAPSSSASSRCNLAPSNPFGVTGHPQWDCLCV